MFICMITFTMTKVDRVVVCIALAATIVYTLDIIVLGWFR